MVGHVREAGHYRSKKGLKLLDWPLKKPRKQRLHKVKLVLYPLRRRRGRQSHHRLMKCLLPPAPYLWMNPQIVPQRQIANSLPQLQRGRRPSVLFTILLYLLSPRRKMTPLMKGMPLQLLMKPMLQEQLLKKMWLLKPYFLKKMLLL